MFEKEAEEIANKRCHEIMCYGHCSFSSPKHHRCGEWHREYKCALKGAEFGYNKAKEWRYVKDELPELYKDVLVVFSQGNCDVKHLTNHNEWVGRGSWCSLTDVIAWKEIPELKESE